jgi:acetylornithine deacetylase/succinyl-diaminopimelate desuccinylase-like protein
MAADVTSQATELLQQLIRNACINDGARESGEEHRNVATLSEVLSGGGMDVQRYEPVPGRQSLVARIEGSDPTAPSLLLMGHTDVVPANPEGWQRDPFGGELVGGEIWGRGAIDMLNLTATMALAVRRLADADFRPRGTLIYLAVADEEAGGNHGAKWLGDHEWEDIRADYVITESGGVPIQTEGGQRLWVIAGEKGVNWRRLTIHGTPGHGSRPLRTDNAVVKAAEVVQRIAEHRTAPHIGEIWRRHVEGMGFSPEASAALTDPARVAEGIRDMPDGLARQVHACTHMTLAPTVIHGGTKTNVIPDRVQLDVDVRTLPGQTDAEVDEVLREAMGDLAEGVEIEAIFREEATSSPIDNPLWDAMERAAQRFYPEARCVPSLSAGGTDARVFRERGVPSYGFGLFSERMSADRFVSMYHGNDERVDQESLRLSTEMWQQLARDFLI